MKGRFARNALRAFADDYGLANTIATSGRASVAMLRELLKSRHQSVREHAELALIVMRLEEGVTPLYLKRLLAKYRGDGGISLGVRDRIASDVRTPREILCRLAEDEADFVAASARRTIEEQRKTRRRKQRPRKARSVIARR